MIALSRRLLRSLFARNARTIKPIRARFAPKLTALDERAVPDATQVFQGSFAIGDGMATVNLTVTEDMDGFEGLYYWDYKVTNNADPAWNYDRTCEFNLTGVPFGNATSQGNSSGWFQSIYYENPSSSFTYWWYGEDTETFEETNWLEHGETADFCFFTEPVTLVDATAHVYYWYLEDETGTVKAPGIPKATTTSLGVDAVWPDSSPVPTGLFLTAFVAGNPGLGDPTGWVDFMDGDTLLGSAELVGNGNGTALATLTWTTAAPGMSFGEHPILAEYEGDASHLKSVSDTSPLSLTEETFSEPDHDDDWGYGDGPVEDPEGENENEEGGGGAGPTGPTDGRITPDKLRWPDYRTVPSGEHAAFTGGEYRSSFDAPEQVRLSYVKVSGGFEVVVRTTGKAEFDVVFSREKSYVVSGQETDALLKHERLHLGIAQYTAVLATRNQPNFSAKASGTAATVAGAEVAAKAASRAAWEAAVLDWKRTVWEPFDEQLQVHYDTMTSHGNDATAQAWWEANWKAAVDFFAGLKGWTV